MNPLLKKLHFKGQTPVLLVDSPPEFAKTAAEFGVTIHSRAKGDYSFALAFARSLTEADTTAELVKDALEESAIFWLAYPKGTSKRYKGADINRDTLHARLGKQGLEGV